MRTTDRLAIALLLTLSSAAFADKDDSVDFKLYAEAGYDWNVAFTSPAAAPVPDANVFADAKLAKGDSFGMKTEGDVSTWWSAALGAELAVRLSLLHGGLSQAWPELWLTVNRHATFGRIWLTAQGAYHLWGHGEANAIEPSGWIGFQSARLFGSRPVFVLIGGQQQVDMRIAQSDNAALRSVYGGLAFHTTAWIDVSCTRIEGCTSLAPESIRLEYGIEVGDLISIGPSTADATAAAQASAPSTLLDTDQALGFTAYRMRGLRHSLSVRLLLTQQLYVRYMHQIFVAGSAFQATNDQVLIGYFF